MKSLTTICFVFGLSVSMNALAGVEAFNLSQGQFDSKHFALDRAPSASLKINSGTTSAHLKITESSCRIQDGSGCTDMKRTRLNQTFTLIATETDGCNVTTYKSPDRPAALARSRFDRTSLMMAEIELRDTRLSTCKHMSPMGLQVIVRTHTTSSAGVSTLTFQSQGSEVAQKQSNSHTKDGFVRSESFLFSGI